MLLSGQKGTKAECTAENYMQLTYGHVRHFKSKQHLGLIDVEYEDDSMCAADKCRRKEWEAFLPGSILTAT